MVAIRLIEKVKWYNFKGNDEKHDNINSEEEIYKTATYIDRWRFHLIYNEIRTIEFFYNSGSLAGDKVMMFLTLFQWLI